MHNMTRQTNAQHDTLCNKTTCTTHDTWNLIASNLMHAIFFESERAKCTFPQKCHSSLGRMWGSFHCDSNWPTPALIDNNAATFDLLDCHKCCASQCCNVSCKCGSCATSKIGDLAIDGCSTTKRSHHCSTTKWMPRIWEPFRHVLTPIWGHGYPKS